MDTPDDNETGRSLGISVSDRPSAWQYGGRICARPLSSAENTASACSARVSDCFQCKHAIRWRGAHESPYGLRQRSLRGAFACSVAEAVRVILANRFPGEQRLKPLSVDGAPEGQFSRLLACGFQRIAHAEAQLDGPHEVWSGRTQPHSQQRDHRICFLRGNIYDHREWPGRR